MSISDGTDFGSTAVEKWGSNKKKNLHFLTKNKEKPCST